MFDYDVAGSRELVRCIVSRTPPVRARGPTALQLRCVKSGS